MNDKVSSPRQQVTLNGVAYAVVTFDELFAHMKYSIFGVPRFGLHNLPVLVLGTFDGRNLSFTRRDFKRSDNVMGRFGFMKSPNVGPAGICLAIGPNFDDPAWSKCQALWEDYRAHHGATAAAPRFFFLGHIIFDKRVLRSPYFAVDTILFAKSHADDPAIPDPSSAAAAIV